MASADDYEDMLLTALNSEDPMQLLLTQICALRNVLCRSGAIDLRELAVESLRVQRTLDEKAAEFRDAAERTELQMLRDAPKDLLRDVLRLSDDWLGSICPATWVVTNPAEIVTKVADTLQQSETPLIATDTSAPVRLDLLAVLFDERLADYEPQERATRLAGLVKQFVLKRPIVRVFGVLIARESNQPPQFWDALYQAVESGQAISSFNLGPADD